MPMRVEGASSFTALMRLSIQRAIQTLTTTNMVTVAMAFSTDQIVIRVALGEADRIELRDHRAEPAEHFGGEQRPDDQRRAKLPGLDAAALAEDRRSRNITRRIRARSASSVQAVAYHGRDSAPAASCATMMIEARALRGVVPRLHPPGGCARVRRSRARGTSAAPRARRPSR
jgi:hypothetical protein